jgi:hypothetical protein
MYPSLTPESFTRDFFCVRLIRVHTSTQGYIMKTLLATLALTLTASAFAAPSLTFTETYIEKTSTSQYGIYYKTNRNVKSWCTGLGNPISFGSFEAAEKVDSLSDGLFRCEGKFVQVPGDRQNAAQVYAINGCTEVNPAELKADCPPVKPIK